MTPSHAQVIWDHEQPISAQFDDVYFCKGQGLAESRYIYIERNQLPDRFRQLTSGQRFTIVETGFGSGLNALLTAQHFNALAPKDAQLHFISTELYPLSHEDLSRALQNFPSLQQFIEPLLNGYHTEGEALQLKLTDNVSLTILWGDAQTRLTTLVEPVDAWFLDGFAPAKNPQMWQDGLFQTMARLRKPTTSYATFSAAAVVKNGVKSAGFTVIKQPGFGKKRDMIHGHVTPSSASQPWFSHAPHVNREKTVVVVGAGIAGASTAYALAKRGWQVTVLERREAVAMEGSGNPQGVLYAKLSANDTPLSQFIVHGYHYSLELLKSLNIQEANRCGIVQLSTSSKVDLRYQALGEQHNESFLRYLNAAQLSELSGLALEQNGLFYPEAGWVNPPALCRGLLDHPNITVHTEQAVIVLDKQPVGWQIRTQQQTWQSNTVVITQGIHGAQFPALQHLPLKKIRGQITVVKATTASRKLSSCVCGEGYIIPEVDGHHTLGATFNFNEESLALNAADHAENLRMLQDHFPAMHTALGGDAIEISDGRANFRCTSPDYLPIIGPVVDVPSFIETFAALRKNRKHRFNVLPPYADGLYISAGHGSRGMISGPISGEILAAQINHEPSPIPQPLLEAIHPSRFLVRDLIRNKL